MQAEMSPLPSDVSSASITQPTLGEEVVQSAAISPAEVPPAPVIPEVPAPVMSPEIPPSSIVPEVPAPNMPPMQAEISPLPNDVSSASITQPTLGEEVVHPAAISPEIPPVSTAPEVPTPVMSPEIPPQMPEVPAPNIPPMQAEISPLPSDVSSASITQPTLGEEVVQSAAISPEIPPVSTAPEVPAPVMSPEIPPQMPEVPAPNIPPMQAEISPLPSDVSSASITQPTLGEEVVQSAAISPEIPPVSTAPEVPAPVMSPEIPPQMPEVPAPNIPPMQAEISPLPSDVSSASITQPTLGEEVVQSTAISPEIPPQMPEVPAPNIPPMQAEISPLPSDVSSASITQPTLGEEVVQSAVISPAEVPPAPVIPEVPAPNMPLQNDPAIDSVDQSPQSSVNTLETSERVPQYMIDELDHSIKDTIAAVCALDLDKSIILQISGAVNQLHRSGNIEHFIAILQLVAVKHKNDISPNVFELLQQHIHTLSKPYEEDKSLLLSLGSRNEVFNNIVVAIQNREFGLIAKIICSMDYDDNRKEMIALLKKEMAEQDFNQVNILIEQHDNIASQSSSGTLWNRIKGFFMSKKRSN